MQPSPAERRAHSGDHGRGADAASFASQVMVWANCQA
jgi:hypothetical protein